MAQTPAPLTMQQAVDLARMQNPSLLSANAHVDATKQSEITAGLRVNPNFSFNGQDVTLPASANNPYFYSAQVSRLFERGQKRRWRLDIARSTTDVTRSQYADPYAPGAKPPPGARDNNINLQSAPLPPAN